jgi:hypothetical protein
MKGFHPHHFHFPNERISSPPTVTAARARAPTRSTAAMQVRQCSGAPGQARGRPGTPGPLLLSLLAATVTAAASRPLRGAASLAAAARSSCGSSCGSSKHLLQPLRWSCPASSCCCRCSGAALLAAAAAVSAVTLLAAFAALELPCLLLPCLLPSLRWSCPACCLRCGGAALLAAATAARISCHRSAAVRQCGSAAVQQCRSAAVSQCRNLAPRVPQLCPQPRHTTRMHLLGR